MKKLSLIIFACTCFLAAPSALAEIPTFDSVIELVEAGKVEELRTVIRQNPAAVHQVNPNGMPLLLRAVMSDKTEAVAVLIKAGSKLDSVDETARTPLHIAAGWSTLSMVELLWKNGANPKAKTERGDTPLDFAHNNFYQDKKVERDKIITFLEGKGAVMSEGEKERQAIIKETEDQIAARPDKGAEPKQSKIDGSVYLVFLGSMYDQGEGVPKDDVEAVKWYRKAAAQENASAQSSLGVMYA